MLALYYPNRFVELQKNCLYSFMETEAARLKKEKYRYASAQGLLRSISYFGDWLQENHIHLKDVDENIAQKFIDQFIPPRSRGKKARKRIDRLRFRTAANRILNYLQEKYPKKIKQSPIEREAVSFYDYLINERNISKGTCKTYKKYLCTFLQYFFSDKKLSLKSLTPKMIRDYIEWIPSTLDERKRKDTCSMLRNYFRFSAIKGKNTSSHLFVGIPSFQSKYHAPPAEYLTEDNLRILLHAIDDSTANAKRTYASILCQTDLCMRIGDVAKLTLDDIDWRNGKIRINNNKGREPYWLPLPQRVGQAIADYLKNERPESDSRFVFLSCRWWRNIPGQTQYFHQTISLLWKKSGLNDQYSGTHVFRHYGAMRLKEQKCSIKVISDILGHESLQTTAIYAKLDIPALRTIAGDWPEEACHEK